MLYSIISKKYLVYFGVNGCHEFKDKLCIEFFGLLFCVELLLVLLSFTEICLIPVTTILFGLLLEEIFPKFSLLEGEFVLEVVGITGVGVDDLFFGVKIILLSKPGGLDTTLLVAGKEVTLLFVSCAEVLLLLLDGAIDVGGGKGLVNLFVLIVGDTLSKAVTAVGVL